jgi:tetratricopeptide (TPR) repeat protein
VPSIERPKLIRLICLSLAAITLLVYWPVTGFDFTNYDDTDYVIYNAPVQEGLTLHSIGWAFTSGHASNWHPLTWLSHMLDCQIYGADKPGGHHFTNLLLHTADAVLLFFVLVQFTGAIWRAALVAALFAWHPLHVESVAWVAERKDVLSAFFMLLTFGAYGAYAREFQVRSSKFKVWYGLALFLFACGLMSKPMLVTLPFLLVLLDYWPLQRISSLRFSGGDFQKEGTLARSLFEKIPFLVLAVLDCIATLVAQKHGDSVVASAALPFSERIANALVSYVQYLSQTFYPHDLALPYPYPNEFNWLPAIGAGALLLVLTATVVLLARERRWLAVGWFWFLGTLVPVIGLVAVGLQSHADRYTYIPLIGIFIMLAWSIPAARAKWPRPGLVFGAIVAALLMCLVTATAMQMQYWRNSVTLFSHTLATGNESILAEYNLAAALGAQGTNDEVAALHYQNALALKLNRVEAEFNSQPEAYFNLGLIYRKHGAWTNAETSLRAFLKLRPNVGQGHVALGSVLLSMGRLDDAAAELNQAIKLEPLNTAAMQNLAAVLLRQGKTADAEAEYREAQKVRPDLPDAANGLAWLLATKPQSDPQKCIEAVALAESICKQTGDREPRFLATLDAAYAAAGRYIEAMAAAEKTRSVALSLGNSELAAAAQKRLESYRFGQPWRE